FAPDESPRSLQLYTVDAEYTYAAAKMIVDEDMADHIDINFGCPVPKVTRRGGGSAIPYKRRLFRSIVAAAVRATEGTDIPVTVKMRVGIDDEHHTHLDAGRIAVDEGARAVALHARTAAQRYSGEADWSQISRLVEHVGAVSDVPVLGNGDIFSAEDAVRMREETGCAGSRIMYRHGALLAEHHGEDKGMRDIRKHVSWYLRGFPAGSGKRVALSGVRTLADLAELLADLPADEPFPADGYGPRGRQGSASKVLLPEGWLDDPEDDAAALEGAEVHNSGG